jgi:hypothetical protein
VLLNFRRERVRYSIEICIYVMLVSERMHQDLKCALHGYSAVNMTTLKTQGPICMYISRMIHVRDSIESTALYFLFYVIHNLYIGEFHNIFGITKGIAIYSVVLIFVNILLLLLNNCFYAHPVKVALVCLQQLVHSLLQCVIIQLVVFS